MKISGKFGVKSLVLASALALVLGIGGITLAWLSDETETVTNTFTYGDINIDLTETDADGDGDLFNNEYKMIPGSDIEKDPTVTIEAGSEKCYVFAEIEEKGGNVTIDGKTYSFDDFITYAVADGWELLSDENGISVYYRVVDVLDAADDAVFEVLDGNKVTAKGDVTKEMLNALGNDYPKLLFTAYAVQFENIASAAEAWELAKASANS